MAGIQQFLQPVRPSLLRIPFSLSYACQTCLQSQFPPVYLRLTGIQVLQLPDIVLQHRDLLTGGLKLYQTNQNLA